MVNSVSSDDVIEQNIGGPLPGMPPPPQHLMQHHHHPHPQMPSPEAQMHDMQMHNTSHLPHLGPQNMSYFQGPPQAGPSHQYSLPRMALPLSSPDLQEHPQMNMSDEQRHQEDSGHTNIETPQ